MSLIKAVDVPKYMADKVRSRRLAARLTGGSAKPALVVPKAVAIPAVVKESPAR
jgi:hypothetical protein